MTIWFNLLFFIINSPLDQFDYFLLTFHTSFFIWNVLIVITVFGVLLSNNFSKKKNLKKIFVFFTKLAEDMYKSNFLSYRNEHKTLMTLLFLIMMFYNLCGLVPYSYTITSMLSFTLFLALTHFMYMNMIMILKNKWKVTSIFLPTKNIYWIAPALMIMELISYFSSVMSLSLRLFANMVAGHALMKMLMIFFFLLLNLWMVTYTLPMMLIWVGLVLLFFLETFLAMLQAYVFTLLMTLYLNDIEH